MRQLMHVWKDELNHEKEKRTACKKQWRYREMAQGQKNLGCLENGSGLRVKGVQGMEWSHPNAFKKEVVTRQEYALKDTKV